MRNDALELFVDQPEQGLLFRLFFVQQVSLALVAQIASLALLAHLFAPIARILPAGLMDISAPLAIISLLSAASLFLSEAGRSKRMVLLSRVFGSVAALVALAVFLEPVLHISLDFHPDMHAGGSAWLHQPTPLRPAVAFALIGVLTVLIRATSGLVGYMADVFAACLCLLALILSSEFLYSTVQLFGPAFAPLTSLVVLVCLLLLSAVVILRRMECGAFSLFLGHGIGSRISRVLAPILIALPPLREAMRVRVMNAHLIPLPYATAILASAATVISLGLLMYLAARINSMEREIHSLSLRDELTGIYNLRGFQLLARQALRLAQRANVPFSVLFIDLDNLKKVNDEFGHKAGSAFLAETGELLSSTFRETDVIGRIGGDEFAVAGQFTQEEISEIAHLLQQSAALRSAEKDRQYPLSFSTGFVTCAQNSRLSLNDLLSRADRAMYQEKRQKKSRSHGHLFSVS
ncbi:MAG TPA: GGDEF domain-containing protein [Terracidiphilus sp.]|nr:GGDEF domain-containing protein [Terracidiphilus sp.]